MIELTDSNDSTFEPNDLEGFLSDYTESKEFNENGEPEKTTLGVSQLIDFDENDKSNPKIYYQSGKKQGQKKPNADNYIKKVKAGLLNPNGDKVSSSEPEKRSDKTTLKGTLISGYLFITLIDVIFPMIISLLNNYLSKSKIKTKDLKMSSEQKRELAPICDEVIKEWELTTSPTAIFLISMAAIYGHNYLNAVELNK